MAEKQVIAEGAERKALAVEIAEAREKLYVVFNRLNFIHDGLNANANSPDHFSVEGAASILFDTIRMMDRQLCKLMEETALSEYLDLAGEITNG